MKYFKTIKKFYQCKPTVFLLKYAATESQNNVFTASANMNFIKKNVQIQKFI